MAFDGSIVPLGLWNRNLQTVNGGLQFGFHSSARLWNPQGVIDKDTAQSYMENPELVEKFKFMQTTNETTNLLQIYK